LRHADNARIWSMLSAWRLLVSSRPSVLQKAMRPVSDSLPAMASLRGRRACEGVKAQTDGNEL
jgi:hypothetical protein